MSAHPPAFVTRLLTDQDLEGFTSGKVARAYEKLGARLGTKDGVAGAFVAVWAPEANHTEVTRAPERAHVPVDVRVLGELRVAALPFLKRDGSGERIP